MLVLDALDAYLRHLAARGCSPRTLETVAADARLVGRLLGPGAALDPTALALLTERLRPGRQASTINRTLRHVRAAARHAERMGLLERAPRIELVREVTRAPRAPTAEQVELLLRATIGVDRMACALAAFAGLRASEIIHAEWADVRDGRFWFTAKPEHGLKNRTESSIVMHPTLVALLAETPRVGRWLIASPRTVPALSRRVSRTMRACGIREPGTCGLHALRRAFVSRLLGNGLGLADVMQLARHASLASTQRYLTTNSAAQDEAVRAL